MGQSGPQANIISASGLQALDQLASSLARVLRPLREQTLQRQLDQLRSGEPDYRQEPDHSDLAAPEAMDDKYMEAAWPHLNSLVWQMQDDPITAYVYDGVNSKVFDLSQVVSETEWIKLRVEDASRVRVHKIYVYGQTAYDFLTAIRSFYCWAARRYAETHHWRNRDYCPEGELNCHEHGWFMGDRTMNFGGFAFAHDNLWVYPMWPQDDTGDESKYDQQLRRRKARFNFQGRSSP